MTVSSLNISITCSRDALQIPASAVRPPLFSSVRKAAPLIPCDQQVYHRAIALQPQLMPIVLQHIVIELLRDLGGLGFVPRPEFVIGPKVWTVSGSMAASS